MKMTNFRQHISKMVIGAGWLVAFAAPLISGGCSDSESYSDLLRDEEKAVNWYLADQKVEVNLPPDNNFITGEDAPFYKLDEDGYVYMQVINKGDMENRAQTGDRVYFIFSGRNIKNLYETGFAAVEGNSGTITSSTSSFYFIYGDMSVTSSTTFGSGIQMPLDYLGYFSEVNLIVKSYAGFNDTQSTCLPYVMNVKYLKPEY